ncbi:MAG: hypothetical protein ABSG34_16990 [Candidatus Sulfotelmatobacter sp.]|jgi:hypothetical protein
MLIHVPRPPKSAFNPDRPVSSLLKAQMEYLHEAEKRLPSRYHSEIYVNAIKTEGEAAKYIRHVTEAIHEAHLDAAFARIRVVPKRKRTIEIAAVADESAERKSASQKKRSGKKSVRKDRPKT